MTVNKAWSKLLSTVVEEKGKMLSIQEWYEQNEAKDLSHATNSSEDHQVAFFVSQLLRRQISTVFVNKPETEFYEEFRIQDIPHMKTPTKRGSSQELEMQLLETVRNDRIKSRKLAKILDMLKKYKYRWDEGKHSGQSATIVIGACNAIRNSGGLQKYLQVYKDNPRDGPIYRVLFVGPKVLDLAHSAFQENSLAVDTNVMKSLIWIDRQVKGGLPRSIRGVAKESLQFLAKSRGRYQDKEKILRGLADYLGIHPYKLDRILWRFGRSLPPAGKRQL